MDLKYMSYNTKITTAWECFQARREVEKWLQRADGFVEQDSDLDSSNGGHLYFMYNDDLYRYHAHEFDTTFFIIYNTVNSKGMKFELLYSSLAELITSICEWLGEDVFNTFGWNHVDTGGSCTAYSGHVILKDKVKREMFITDTGNDLQAPISPLDEILVGFYSQDCKAFLEACTYRNFFEFMEVLYG